MLRRSKERPTNWLHLSVISQARCDIKNVCIVGGRRSKERLTQSSVIWRHAAFGLSCHLSLLSHAKCDIKNVCTVCGNLASFCRDMDVRQDILVSLRRSMLAKCFRQGGALPNNDEVDLVDAGGMPPKTHTGGKPPQCKVDNLNVEPAPRCNVFAQAECSGQENANVIERHWIRNCAGTIDHRRHPPNKIRCKIYC